MGADYMLDELLEGRISTGKSKRGDAPDVVNLQIAGRRLYQMQRFLEEEIQKGGELARVIWLVAIHKELRQAYCLAVCGGQGDRREANADHVQLVREGTGPKMPRVRKSGRVQDRVAPVDAGAGAESGGSAMQPDQNVNRSVGMPAVSSPVV